jgi:hypothetical protein
VIDACPRFRNNHADQSLAQVAVSAISQYIISVDTKKATSDNITEWVDRGNKFTMCLTSLSAYSGPPRRQCRFLQSFVSPMSTTRWKIGHVELIHGFTLLLEFVIIVIKEVHVVYIPRGTHHVQFI